MTQVPRMFILAAVAVVAGIVVEPALAVSVQRAELSGSRLRLEGTAIAGRDITADGTVVGRSDGSGQFRAERDPFTAPADCTVDVADGSTATTVQLSGCTVVAPAPPPGDRTPPTAPTELTASLAGSTANLSWTPSTDAGGVAGYRVSRNGTALPGTVTGTTFADPGLSAGTFTYTVAAVDAAGNVSAASNSASVTVASAGPAPADTVAPTVPANLRTTVVGTTVSLSWDASEDATAVTGYRVARNGTVIGTTQGTTFTDSGLAAGTHTYTVSAFDAAGNTSAPSIGASATVGSTALAFLTPAQLPDAVVGQAYLASIVVSDPPGPSTFEFKVVSGKAPPGTRFLRNTLENRPEARISGTPSTAGTFSLTVEVEDNTGATVRRAFSVRVLAQ